MARSIDQHREGCTCHVCRTRGRQTGILTVRLPQDLLDWVRERGGTAYVRQLLEREWGGETGAGSGAG